LAEIDVSKVGVERSKRFIRSKFSQGNQAIERRLSGRFLLKGQLCRLLKADVRVTKLTVSLALKAAIKG
jgi:hypothetical protein